MSETGIKLRSPNWRSMKLPAAPTAGYTRGDMRKINDTVVVVVETVTVGQIGVGIYQAEKIVVPKVTGTGREFAVGDKVYFKGASSYAVTDQTTGNTLCGRCLVAAGATDATVEIELNGQVEA